MLLVTFCVARHCAYCIFNCHSPTDILSSIVSDRLRIKFHFVQTRLQNISLTTGSNLVRNIIVNCKGACSQHRRDRQCQTLSLCRLPLAFVSVTKLQNGVLRSVLLLSRMRKISFDISLRNTYSQCWHVFLLVSSTFSLECSN